MKLLQIANKGSLPFSLLITCFLNFNIFGMDQGNPFKYIPAQSSIRSFCLQRENNENCKTIKQYLELMTQSYEQNKQIEDIDDKISQANKRITEVNKEATTAQENNIADYDFYAKMAKAKNAVRLVQLNQQKAKLVKNYVPQTFPKKGNLKDISVFNKAMKNIIEANNFSESKENEYLQAGFANAYRHKRPWNTHSIGEKSLKIGAPIGFIALSIGLATLLVNLGITS